MQIICLWSWPRIFITIRDSVGLLWLWAALRYPAVPLPSGVPFMPACEGICAPEAFSFTVLKVMAFQQHLFLSPFSCFFFFHIWSHFLSADRSQMKGFQPFSIHTGHQPDLHMCFSVHAILYLFNAVWACLCSFHTPPAIAWSSI